MNRIVFNTGLLRILFIITLLICIGIMFIQGNAVIPLLSRVLTFFWLWILFKSSTIRKTFYFRIMLVFLAILMLGLLFKLEHLPGASMLMSTSILGLMITYLIRTFNKKKKVLLDWLKLSWFIAVAFISLGILEHLISPEYGIISTVLFLTMIGVFCLNPEQHLMLAKNYYSDGDRKIQ